MPSDSSDEEAVTPQGSPELHTAEHSTDVPHVPHIASSGFEAGTVLEHQYYAAAPTHYPAMIGDHSLPHTAVNAGPSMGYAAYPYAEPYFQGVFAAYGTQAMVYPHLLGVQQARKPLPSELTEEEPVYVNAKQYRGILRRRESRAKAECENKLVKSRKPYLHESRHLHAKRRARGCGGRFLKKKTDEGTQAHADSASDGQSSQGCSTPDSQGQLNTAALGSQGQSVKQVAGIGGCI